MKAGEDSKLKNLIWFEKISIWLDSKFIIPGTKIKFGLDPIVGLVPIIGDLTSFAVSCGLILYMIKHGASRKVVIIMLGNVIIDTVIGSIPLIGNIFDFAFKANTRNIRVLRKHYQEGKYQGRGTGILLIVAAGLLLIIFLVIYLLTKIGIWFLELISTL
jgi:hypothetical protein